MRCPFLVHASSPVQMAAEVKNITVHDVDAPDEWIIAVATVEELLNHVAAVFRQPGFLSFRKSDRAGVVITPHFQFKDLPSALLWTHRQQGMWYMVVLPVVHGLVNRLKPCGQVALAMRSIILALA